MFLLVPAYPGCPGSKAVKRSLLLLSVNVLVSVRNSKNVDVGKVDRPLTILYTLIRSALLRLSSKVYNPSRCNRSV